MVMNCDTVVLPRFNLDQRHICPPALLLSSTNWGMESAHRLHHVKNGLVVRCLVEEAQADGKICAGSRCR